MTLGLSTREKHHRSPPPPSSRRQHPANAPLRIPRRSRRATALCLLLIGAVVYYSLQTITVWTEPTEYGGVPDLGSFQPSKTRYEHRKPYFSGVKTAPKMPLPIKGGPPVTVKKKLEPGISGKTPSIGYSKHIVFPYLYGTISKTIGMGNLPQHRMILFIAGNLKAASRLLGIACEMSRYGAVVPHFALMGRSTIELDTLARLNGIGTLNSHCTVTVHDARLDHLEDSTQERIERGVKGALRHFNNFMHPKAVITDPEHEDEWFIESARAKIKELGLTAIELPSGGIQRIPWFTRLDVGSLSAWDKVHIEIIVKADAFSGNLKRLLHSLKNAHYFGILPSRLTVQFSSKHGPSHITRNYLRDFKWPSQDRFSVSRPLRDADVTTTAYQFVEKFNPINDNTYLLTLDVNVELSPLYFHYLFHAILHYRHTYYTDSSLQKISSVSLLPAKTEKQIEKSGHHTILSPIPSGNATLLFPEHWIQFHEYLRKRASAPEIDRSPVYAEKLAYEPSWLHLFSELSAARGWHTVYPRFTDMLAIHHAYTPSTLRSQPEPPQGPGFASKVESFTKALLDGEGGTMRRWYNMKWTDLEGKDSDYVKAGVDAMRYKAKIGACGGTTEFSDTEDVSDLFCMKGIGGRKAAQSEGKGGDQVEEPATDTSEMTTATSKTTTSKSVSSKSATTRLDETQKKTVTPAIVVAPTSTVKYPDIKVTVAVN